METLFSLRRDFPARLLTRLRNAARSLKSFAPFALLAALGIASSAAHGQSVASGSVQQTLVSNLSSQIGIAVDAHGNLFIADAFNNQVKEVLASTEPPRPTLPSMCSAQVLTPRPASLWMQTATCLLPMKVITRSRRFSQSTARSRPAATAGRRRCGRSAARPAGSTPRQVPAPAPRRSAWPSRRSRPRSALRTGRD